MEPGEASAENGPYTQEEFKEYLRFTWRDPVGRTFSIVLAVVALPYLFPVLSQGFFAAHWGNAARLVLIPLTILAFQYQLGQVSSWRERRFWNLFSLAYLFWWGAKWITVVAPDAALNTLTGLAADGFFLAFYLALLLAADTRPDWGSRDSGGALEEVLAMAGAAVLIAGLFAYFVVFPVWAKPEIYSASLASLCYSIALDALLGARLIYLQGVARRPRWKVLYGLTGLTILLWAGLDSLQLLNVLGAVEWKPGSLVELLWYVEAVPILLAARDAAPAPGRGSDPALFPARRCAAEQEGGTRENY